MRKRRKSRFTLQGDESTTRLLLEQPAESVESDTNSKVWMKEEMCESCVLTDKLCVVKMSGNATAVHG